MDRIKILGIAAFVIALGFVLRRCNRDPQTPSSLPSLASNEQAKVFVDGDRVTVIKRNADGSDNVTTKYVPEHGTITFEKDGTVNISVKEFGYQIEPGVGLLASNEGAAVAFDVQLLYWKRIGLNLGTALRIGVPAKNVDDVIRDGVRPFIAVSYRLPWKLLSNTSVMLGYEPLQRVPCLGIRIQL